jgi:hypothetical protein
VDGDGDGVFMWMMQITFLAVVTPIMHNFWDMKDGSEVILRWHSACKCPSPVCTHFIECTPICTAVADRGHGAVLQERRAAGVTAHLRFGKEWPKVQGGLSFQRSVDNHQLAQLSPLSGCEHRDHALLRAKKLVHCVYWLLP